MDVIEMYASGMSIPLVSKATGVAKSTIRFRLKKAGVLRSRSDAIRLAAKDGRLSHMKGKSRIFTDEWKANISKAALIAKASTSVGVSKKASGYVEFTRGEHKGRTVHVVTMEQHVGRRLFANECVHHIDGNRSNNSISNLMLMTRADHASLHAKENFSNRKRDENGKFM